MSTSVSATTSAVLNNIAKSFSACGDYPNPVFTSNYSMSADASAAAPQVVHTSGFIAPASFEGGLPTSYVLTTTNTVEGQSITTTEALQNAQTAVVIPNSQLQSWPNQQFTIPNDNTYYPNIGLPYIGDPVPLGGAGGGGLNWPSYPPIKIVPDLDSLEEGVHDIPGGKVIIKKIKITEEQLDNAIQEALGHEASPEEKAAIIKEIEELSASEEREV